MTMIYRKLFCFIALIIATAIHSRGMNIDIEDFTIDRGGACEASVNMDPGDAATPFSGFQFDINLPSDIAVADIKLGDALRDFSLQWKAPVEGVVRVVAFGDHSSASDIYSDIASITFAASPGALSGKQTISITNAMASRPDATEVMFADSDVAVTINVPVTSITVTPLSSDIRVGGQQVFTAEIQPADATDGSIVWSVSQEAYVSIEENGNRLIVTGKEPGEGTVITAVSVSTPAVSGQATVNVLPIEATGITLDVRDLTLLVGESEQLKATVTPENVTDPSVTWQSDNDAVATVSADGTVTAVSVGFANITATCGEASATCRVTVEKKLEPDPEPEPEPEPDDPDVPDDPDDPDGPDDPEPEVVRADTPVELLRKGDGTSHTFVAMMESDDEALESQGYRYVFGFTDATEGSVVLEDTPWRYTYTTEDIFWNGTYDFWVFAYYLDTQGKICVSSRRHLDGSVDEDFDPMDFIGADSRSGAHIVGIYTMEGRYAGKDIWRLKPGIYVIRTTKSSYKLIK